MAKPQGYCLNCDRQHCREFESRDCFAARATWLERELDKAQRSLPDDLRKQGWSVAVHNDYRLDGYACTFWLLTKGDRCVKGEGRTDAEALDEIRVILAQGKDGEHA